ncbi:MAG: hypothetical protein Fur002_10930 [Anaerolineales bacterium]
MKQDKFLTGILVGIGALILLALALFFARQDSPRKYVSDAEPDGVVHNYILAALNKDYQKAYGYLADLDHKPTYDEFRQAFFNGSVNLGNAGVEVGAADVFNDEAVVTLTIHYANNDPFSNNYSSEERASLIRQNGAWKLTYMPYQFWAYSWYQDMQK